MTKKYTNSRESGCGCWTIIGIVFFLGILIEILPYLIGMAVVALIIAVIIYYPKYQQKRQYEKERAELAERHRQLDLEQQRRELERREAEMHAQSKEFQSDEDSNWDDF